MATIQIRDVPDDVHRTIRERAASAGMSVQEYLRAELTTMARSRSVADMVGDVERRLREEGESGFARSSSAAVVRADRRAH